MNRGAQLDTVHGVTESDRTEHTHTHTHTHTHSYFVIFKIETRIWGIKAAMIIQTTAHIKMYH